MKYPLVSIGLTVVSLTISVEASAATFSKMYAFSDSLSDMGNIYNATTAVNNLPVKPPGINLPPIIPPSPPYVDGRYSNGEIWVELLAKSLGLNLIPSTELAVLSPELPIPSPITLFPELAVNSFFNGATANNSVNFAFGGAQTGKQGSGEFGNLIPGILTQVDWLIKDLQFANLGNPSVPINSLADEDALYIVWAGPNDYWSEVNPNPSNSVANISTAIQSLYNIGARNFLLPNLPDLGQTPRGLIMSDESQRLTNLANSHNTFLNLSIDALALLPEINLIPLDVYSLFNDAINNKEKFGFDNVTEPCLIIINANNFNQCSEPDKYLFWDDRHPTKATHQQLANFALAELKANSKSIPESTPIVPLGMLGLGLCLTKTKQKIG